jgi:hypothetical protein
MRAGAEAMFADLGHFSKKGIQVVVFHQHYTATLRSSPCELFMLWSVQLNSVSFVFR